MIGMQIIFWLSVGLLIYTTVIYYLLLKVFKQNDYKKNDIYFPGITLIISAHNEEKCISEKLLNTLEIGYPKENLQVILADDGSTDKTVEIAKGFEFIEILELSRRGKTIAQNKAVHNARNEILVFSDANNIYTVNISIINGFVLDNTIKSIVFCTVQIPSICPIYRKT